MNASLLGLFSGFPTRHFTDEIALTQSYDNSAYLDGDWRWCAHPFSVADNRLRNGDRSMSFVLSNYRKNTSGSKTA